MKRAFWFAAVFAGILLVLGAQQSDVIIRLPSGARPAIAVPDLRGSGAAQPLMNAFNETLYNDLDASGLFKIVPKTMYPLQAPQQPSDFREQPAPHPPRPTTTERRRRMAFGLVFAAGFGQLSGVRLHGRTKQCAGALRLAV
jgi:hypothetical protein